MVFYRYEVIRIVLAVTWVCRSAVEPSKPTNDQKERTF